MVEDADEAAVPAQSLRAPAEHGADLEHRAGVLARDPPPVLGAERLTAQAPLETLRGGQPPQQLGQMARRERISGDEVEGVGDEVSGCHQRVQPAEARLQRRDAAAQL